MNVSWGGGSFTILLDARTGELLEYRSVDTAGRVHEKFGGRLYYQSRSGMSGAGFIPRPPLWLRETATYRVDTHVVEWPHGGAPTIGDYRVVVPVSHPAGGGIDWTYPFVVERGRPTPYGLPVLVGSLGWIPRLVTGEGSGLEEKALEVTYHSDLESGPQTLRFRWSTPPYGRRSAWEPRILRRVAEGMHSIQFAGSINEPELDCEFWNRLGLHRDRGGKVAKITARVCRAVYNEAELFAGSAEEVAARLQNAAPKNVQFITPSLYLQESGVISEGLGPFEAVGRFQMPDSEWYAFEQQLATAAALNLFRGDAQAIAAVEAALRDGAQGKFDRDAENRQIRVLEARLPELCREHGYLVVTVGDSVAAGNCEVGTLNFSRNRLGGVREIHLRRLAEFLGEHAVRRVVLYKLRVAGAII